MVNPILALSPLFSATQSKKAELRLIQLGDGYQQRSTVTLNAIVEEWEVAANGLTDAQRSTLETALQFYGGVQPFAWSPDPTLMARLSYVCQTWDFIELRPNCHYFNAIFRRVVQGTFVLAGRPLQIICPIPYRITQIQSDGEKGYTWTQISGRSALVDPPDALDPTLYILDDVRDSQPIRFRVALADKPAISDELVIYTTPTSIYDGLSYKVIASEPDFASCRQIPYQVRPAAPPPMYLQRGYSSERGTYTFTWDLPTCDTAFLTETIWQQNKTGQYVDVQRFAASENRLFVASLNTHYRVLSVFNVYGRQSQVQSNRFYFTAGNSLVIGDDKLDGLSFSSLGASVTKLPLGRKGLTVDDRFDGISATSLQTSVTKLPLSRQLLQPGIDSYDGISWTALKTTIQKLELNGIILR